VTHHFIAYHQPGVFVHLHRQGAARADQHRHGQAATQETIGGLEAHQAAAEHQRAACDPQTGQHSLNVILIPHVRNVLECGPPGFNRARISPRGDQQPVESVRGAPHGDGSFLHIDAGHPISKHRLDVQVVIEPGSADRQLFRCDRAFEDQADHGAAVRRSGLVTNQGYAPFRIVLPNGLGGGNTGHAVTDNHVSHIDPREYRMHTAQPAFGL
jgi:hypothetical protein